MWVSALKLFSFLSSCPECKFLCGIHLSLFPARLQSLVSGTPSPCSSYSLPYYLSILSPSTTVSAIAKWWDNPVNEQRCFWSDRHIVDDVGESEISARWERLDIPWHITWHISLLGISPSSHNKARPQSKDLDILCNKYLCWRCFREF